MAFNLPPVPPGDAVQFPQIWRDWFTRIHQLLAANVRGILSWLGIDFTGSNITDIETRRHRDLQDLQGGTTAEYLHLKSNQHALFTSGTSTQVLHGSATLPTWSQISLTADVSGILPAQNGGAILYSFYNLGGF